MNRIRLFSFFFLFLWLLWPGRAVQAASPTSVGLVSFDLIPLDNAVQIEWVTATELNTAGFMIQRGTGEEFEFLSEIGFIISEGGPQIGASYEVVDETAVNGETYTYKLIEFEQNSTQNEVAAGEVTAGIPPTATGIIIGGGGGQNPPPNTPTVPSQTATPSPTATQPVNTTAVSTPTAATTTLPTVAITAVPTTQPTQAANPQNTFFQPGVASAQGETTLPTPTPQAVAQVENNPTPTTPDPYPVQPAQTTAEPNNPTPYPAATSTFLPTLTTFPVVGSDVQLIPTLPAVTTINVNPRPVLSGIAFLWGGFILAFLIFLTAVIGAILLFTRRRQ